jgi:hypothetical protein
MSLDLLGADGLADQYVTLRVTRVDREKLRAKLGGRAGGLAALGVTLLEGSPRYGLAAALPLARAYLSSEYGVELETAASDRPPGPTWRPRSEFWAGLGAGAALGGGALLIWKGLVAPAARLLAGK